MYHFEFLTHISYMLQVLHVVFKLQTVGVGTSSVLLYSGIG
jgi:hypothetical protein